MRTKELEFREDGWVVRWAYLFTENGVPKCTTLCTLFWLCAIWTPVAGLGLILVALVIFIGLPLSVTVLAGMALGDEVALLTVGPIAALLMLNIVFEGDSLAESLGNSKAADNIHEMAMLIGGSVLAIKRKYCPAVRIRR